MKRPRFLRLALLRVLNLALYLLGCFMASTGLALEFRLPPGSRGGSGLTMLGMDRHELGELHFYVGSLLTALAVVHLALHWGWLRNALRVAKGGVGWLGLAAGLAALAIPLLLPVARS